MILLAVDLRIKVDVLAEQLAQIVTCACGATDLRVDAILTRSHLRVDLGVVHTDLSTVNNHIGRQTRVTVGIRILGVVATAWVSDRISVGSGEGIYKVLCRVDASLAIERRRIVVCLPVVVLRFLTTPHHLFRVGTVGERIDLSAVGIPCPTVGIHAADAADGVEHLSSIVSSLLVVGAGSGRESRTGSEQGSFGAEGLDDGSIHTSVELHTEDTVHAVHVSTHLLVVSRYTRVGSYVDILVGQQGQRRVAVSIERLHTLLKSVARQIEVAGGTLRCGDNRHAKKLTTLVVSGMSLKQIVHKHGTHTIRLAFLTTGIETAGHIVVSPVHTVNAAEEEVDIHDTCPTVAPALRRVVVRGPGTAGELTPAVGSIVAHSIIGTHLAERKAAAGNARIGISKHTLGVGRVLVHVVNAEVVLLGGLEEVVAGSERQTKGRHEKEIFIFSCFHDNRRIRSLP